MGRETAKIKDSEATMDWRDCDLIETVPGKVSGQPVIVGTRIPVEAITDNYDSFLEEGLSPDQAVKETTDCYPSAGMQRIKAILEYRASHDLQPHA